MLSGVFGPLGYYREVADWARPSKAPLTYATSCHLEADRLPSYNAKVGNCCADVPVDCPFVLPPQGEGELRTRYSAMLARLLEIEQAELAELAELAGKR